MVSRLTLSLFLLTSRKDCTFALFREGFKARIKSSAKQIKVRMHNCKRSLWQAGSVEIDGILISPAKISAKPSGAPQWGDLIRLRG